MSDTAHADLRQLFYPRLYTPEPAIPAHFALIAARLQRHFALLDQAAANHPALFTPTGVVLPYTAALMRWSVLYPATGSRCFALGTYPTLAPLLAALQATPAAQSVAAREGLGPTPFTAPALPQPPEGTAL